MRLKLLLLMCVFVFLASWGWAACITPHEDYLVNASTKFCAGTYTLNDTNTNGVIRVNADSIQINCSGTTFQGKFTTSSKGIDLNFKDKVTIQGCTFNNYDNGIYASTTYNNTFTNNTFTNTNEGIIIIKSSNTTIESNTFSDGKGADNASIWLQTDNSSDNYIGYNTITGGYYGIRIKDVQLNTTIEYNSISDTIHNSIFITDYDNVNGTIIRYNTVTNSGWNSIEVTGFSNRVYGNILNGWSHVGIDTKRNDDNDNLVGTWGNNIYANYLTGTTLPSIVLRTAHSTSVYNNIITGNRIAAEGNCSTTYNNEFRNNTVINGNWSLYSGACDTYWVNNTLTNPINHEVFIGGFSEDREYYDNSTFETQQTLNFRVASWNLASPFFKCGGENQTYNMTFGEQWRLDACDATANAFPYDELAITADTKFYSGRYYLKDAAGNNLIDTSTASLTIDGNGAEIIGNGTGRGLYVASDNMEIINLNFTNYDRNFWFNGMDKSNVTNVYSYGSDEAGIRCSGCDDVVITSSYFYDDDERAILVTGGSLRTNVTNSFFSGAGDNSIRYESASNFGHVYGNTITNDGDSSIDISKVNDTRVYDNTVTLSGWNSIDVSGLRNRVYDNTVSNPTHHNIDACDDTTLTLDALVYDNVLTNGQIYTCSASSNFTGNTITGGSRGLASEGNVSINYDNYFFDNTVTDVDICMYTGSVGTLFEANTFSFCNNYTVRYGGWFEDTTQTDNATFLNNVYSSGKVYYLAWQSSVNISVNETSTYWHKFNFTSDNTAYLLWNGRKDVNIAARNITINSLPTNARVFNGSTPAPYTGLSGITQEMVSNNRLIITSQADTTDPFPSTIATGITDLTWQYADGTTLLVSTTGTGSVVLDNMWDISSTYSAYRNGVFVEYSDTDTYTMATAGDWSFGQTAYSNKVTVDAANTWVLAIAAMAGMYSLLSLVIMIYFIIHALKNKFEGKKIMIASLLLVQNMIIWTIVTIILVNLATV